MAFFSCCLLVAASVLLFLPRTGGSKAGDVGWLGGQTLFPRIFALPRRAFLFLSKNCFVSINFWAQTLDWEKKQNDRTALSPMATEGSKVCIKCKISGPVRIPRFKYKWQGRTNIMRGRVMIRQCEENKSGCLTAVVRTAAVRTRDNKER